MTKRKRPRYGNPSRQAEENLRRGSSRPGADFRFLHPDEVSSLAGGAGFNQLARPNCSECGAPVEWLTGDQAAAKGIDLAEALQFLGVDGISEPDVWRCTSCGEYGVMGPTEVGF